MQSSAEAAPTIEANVPMPANRMAVVKTYSLYVRGCMSEPMSARIAQCIATG